MNRSLWVLVVCAGTILGLSVGVRQVLGLFLTPMTTDLNLGRESFAFAMGLMNLFWGLGAPIAGAIADKYGASRVAVLGGAVYAIGLLLMAWSGDASQLLIGGTLLGLGLSGSGFTVVLGTVGRLAPVEIRSQALGLVAVGGSVGQFLALPYTHGLIEGFGWVTALIILAATTALIVPLAFGIVGKPSNEVEEGPQNVPDALFHACRTPSFWLLILGFFVCGFHLAFVAVHLPAYLADKAFAPWLATAALTTIGVSNIVGVYCCGYLGDNFPKKNVLSVLYLARAGIFLLFLVTPLSEFSVLVFATLIGFLWLGTVPLTSGLVGNVFGVTYLSMLFGIVFLGHQIGGFLGAWLGGAAFDALGSYDAMWWISVGLGVFSAVVHWPIKERPVAGLTVSL